MLFTFAALTQASGQTIDAAGADQASAGDAQTQLAQTDLVPSPFSATEDAPDPDPQSSSAAQTSSGQRSNTGAGTNQSSASDETQSLRVNPVTGLVSTSASNYQPLTGDQRLKLYFQMNYTSVGAYFGPFFTALVLDQAFNSPYQWGGGVDGYGRRVLSRVGSTILQGTFQAPAAAVLHEDVRYIVSNQRGFKRRAGHAIVYSFLTYNNQGHPTLNVANLGAYYASTAVSTVWLPGQRNLAGYTFGNGSEQIALSVPVNLLQEFWPEIRRTLRGWL